MSSDRGWPGPTSEVGDVPEFCMKGVVRVTYHTVDPQNEGWMAGARMARRGHAGRAGGTPQRPAIRFTAVTGGPRYSRRTADPHHDGWPLHQDRPGRAAFLAGTGANQERGRP